MLLCRTQRGVCATCAPICTVDYITARAKGAKWRHWEGERTWAGLGVWGKHLDLSYGLHLINKLIFQSTNRWALQCGRRRQATYLGEGGGGGECSSTDSSEKFDAAKNMRTDISKCCCCCAALLAMFNEMRNELQSSSMQQQQQHHKLWHSKICLCIAHFLLRFKCFLSAFTLFIFHTQRCKEHLKIE